MQNKPAVNVLEPRLVTKQEAAYYRAKGYSIQYCTTKDDYWMGMHVPDWHWKDAKYRIVPNINYEEPRLGEG